MAAITTIVYSGIRYPWPSATPGAKYAELWRIPASTAGDTQTITSSTLATIEAVVGAASHTALPLAAPNTAALITSVTVAASNFADVLVIGKSLT